VLLLPASTLLAFAAGGTLARLAGAGDGAGLAAAAIVGGYGLLAGVAGLLAGLLFTLWLPPVALRRVALVSLPPAVLLLGWLTAAYLAARDETRRQLAAAYDVLPPFELRLRQLDAAAPRTVEVDGAGRRLTLLDASGRCDEDLAGEERVRLLTALRDVEGALWRQPDLCADVAAPASYELSFHIDEAKPPDTVVELSLTRHCAETATEFTALLDALDWVLRAKGLHQGC